MNLFASGLLRSSARISIQSAKLWKCPERTERRLSLRSSKIKKRFRSTSLPAETSNLLGLNPVNWNHDFMGLPEIKGAEDSDVRGRGDQHDHLEGRRTVSSRLCLARGDVRIAPRTCGLQQLQIFLQRLRCHVEHKPEFILIILKEFTHVSL